jgi:isocitrate/isopropylmalate dehydrogenase
MPWLRPFTAQRRISPAKVSPIPRQLILSTAQLLNWLYQRTSAPACRSTAQLLQHGVAGAISVGTYTVDLGGSTSTSAFASAVIAAMRNADVAA